MRKRVPILLLTTLFAVILLTACSSTYTYTSEFARVKNLCGNNWLVDGNLAVTVQNNCTYRFDPEITERDRAAYIRIHQNILDILPLYGLSGDGMELYVLQDIDSHTGGDKTAYADISLQKCTEQILLTLRAICGEYTNYGYLYGLAADISDNLGWSMFPTDIPDASLFRDTPVLLQLSYPCFTEPYANAEQQNACRILSCYLYLTADGTIRNEKAFMDAIQVYAAENDIPYTSTHLMFSYGTGDCPLKIQTKYLQIYLDSEYPGSCTLSNESMAADPMFHLAPMIAFLEQVDARLTELRALFGHTDPSLLPVYIQPVHQIFSPTGRQYGGMFYPQGAHSYIEASSIYVLTHEYVHYLDDCTGTGDDSWCGEVLAVYYQKDMTYLSRLVSARYGAAITVEWLTELLGQPYDSTEDEILFQHIMTANEENPRYSLISLYNGRLSFGDYFVNTYGEEAFITCMLKPSAAVLHTGLTMDDIVNAWCLWLTQYTQ